VSAVSDVPTVSLSAASGDENCAIELDVTASVLNSIETVENITVSGVPREANLSVGNDNRNGSWTVLASDIGGLKLTLAPDFRGLFELTVSAASTNGRQSDGASLNVKVEPVPETTNLKFMVSNGSPDKNSQTLDLSTLAPDHFVATKAVEFDGEEINVTYVDIDTAIAEFTNECRELTDLDSKNEFATDVTISNFENTDIELDAVGDSALSIENAAQGNILTGCGDDVLDVEALSLLGEWRKLSGIDIKDSSDQVTAADYPDLTGINLDGSYLEAVVDTGEGEDVIIGESGDNTILARAGNDLMSGRSSSYLV
jgi:hypothetical protein